MSRRATLPLNPDAVAKADEDFYANHPEWTGKKLSATDPAQADLRKEWMDAYVANGGAVTEPGKSTPAKPAQPCPKPEPPCKDQGLADPKNIDEYAKDMKKLEADWPTLTKDERKERLEEAVNKQLRKSKTPDVSLVPDPDADSGNAAYDFETSSMEISDKDLEADTMPGDLTDTVYHEARHGEQWSHMARKMAGDEKRKKPKPTDQQVADKIAHDTSMDESIIDNAVKNPITPSSPEFACAEAMTDAVYGKGSDHRDKTLTDLEDKGKIIDSLNADDEKINDADAVLDDPTSTAAEKTKAQADKDKAEASKEKTLKDNGYDTEQEARDDYDKTHKAYTDLPEEADAWDTGGKAQKAFDAL